MGVFWKMNNKYTLKKIGTYIVDMYGNESLVKTTYHIGLLDMDISYIEDYGDEVLNSTSYTIGNGKKTKSVSDIFIFDDKDDIISYVKKNNINIHGYWYGLTPDDFGELKKNSIGAYISSLNAVYNDDSLYI
jgi:hypothetical protein